MFKVQSPKFDFSEPWNICIGERLGQLFKGRFKVAYFYEEPNNSTFRYRAYNMVQALNVANNKDVSASYFFLKDFSYFDLIAQSADLLIICRSRYCHNINYLITKFKLHGKKVLFDIDDLVFNRGCPRSS